MNLILCNHCGSIFESEPELFECANCKSINLVREIDDILFPVVDVLVKKGYKIIKVFRDSLIGVNGKITSFSMYITLDRNAVLFSEYSNLLKTVSKYNLNLFEVTEKQFNIGLNICSGSYVEVIKYIFNTCLELNKWAESLTPCILKEKGEIEGEIDIEFLDLPFSGKEDSF